MPMVTHRQPELRLEKQTQANVAIARNVQYRVGQSFIWFKKQQQQQQKKHEAAKKLSQHQQKL